MGSSSFLCCSFPSMVVLMSGCSRFEKPPLITNSLSKWGQETAPQTDVRSRSKLLPSLQPPFHPNIMTSLFASSLTGQKMIVKNGQANMGAAHIGLARYICEDHRPITSINNSKPFSSIFETHGITGGKQQLLVGKLYHKNQFGFPASTINSQRKYISIFQALGMRKIGEIIKHTSLLS